MTVWWACVTVLVIACQRRASPQLDERIPVVLRTDDVATASVQTLHTGPRIAGTLRAREQSTIIAQVGGPVLAVHAELGERVARGDVLARVEPGDLEDTLAAALAALKSARCAAEVAEREVERAVRLVRLGAIPEQQLELDRNEAQLARAQLAEAEARVASARRSLAETRVRSPLDGVVSQQSVYAGDVITLGAPMFTIIDPSSLRLEASVRSAALQDLQVGATVDFQLHGQPGVTLQGEIARIAPAADPVTGQIDILVSVPNTENRVLAGLFAEGRVVATRKAALAVPQSALDWTGDAPAVTAIRKGVAVRSSIEPGVVDEVQELVEIRAGIAPGERVVLGPAREIASGTPVRVDHRRSLEDPAQARAVRDRPPIAVDGRPSTP